MEKESIQKLFEDADRIAVDYLTGMDRNNIKRVKKIIPDIRQFAAWFLEKNEFGIEQELYQDMCKSLLQILKDIVEALGQEDYVLLHDALDYGFLEYLKLFACRKEEADGEL